jgi:hypothetical protein
MDPPGEEHQQETQRLLRHRPAIVACHSGRSGRPKRLPQDVKNSCLSTRMSLAPDGIRTPRTISSMRGVGGSSVLTQLLVANYEPALKGLDDSMVIEDWDGVLEPSSDDLGKAELSAVTAGQGPRRSRPGRSRCTASRSTLARTGTGTGRRARPSELRCDLLLGLWRPGIPSYAPSGTLLGMAVDPRSPFRGWTPYRDVTVAATGSRRDRCRSAGTGCWHGCWRQ